MDFESVDRKFRNREPLTSAEMLFLASEYQKKITEAKIRYMNAPFNIRQVPAT